MFISKNFWLHNQFNVKNHDDTNSSPFDSFDEDNSQSSSFESPNQFGTPSDTLGWTPWFFRVDASSSTQPLSGWGAGFAPSLRFASNDSSLPSVSAGSGSSPGGSVLSAGAPSGSSPLISPDVIVSTPGSGLEFNNTYGASCTAAFKACIVAAENQLESLFTNSVTLDVTFNESNEGNNGVALGNSSSGYL